MSFGRRNMISAPEVVTAVSIRPFVAVDREPLQRIVEATGVFRPEEVEVAVELMDEVIADPGQTDYHLATAIDAGGVVCGYYCAGPTAMTASTWDLYWIAVDPNMQGKGTGTRLLRHCEAMVRAAGGSLLIVETSSKPAYEPTRRFYARRGYEEAARIRAYYAPDDDLVIFSKSL